MSQSDLVCFTVENSASSEGWQSLIGCTIAKHVALGTIAY